MQHLVIVHNFIRWRFCLHHFGPGGEFECWKSQIDVVEIWTNGADNCCQRITSKSWLQDLSKFAITIWNELLVDPLCVFWEFVDNIGQNEQWFINMWRLFQLLIATLRNTFRSSQINKVQDRVLSAVAQMLHVDFFYCITRRLNLAILFLYGVIK